MDFKFSLTDNNLTAEIQWYGNLSYEIIVAGIVGQNQWILSNSDKLPLVLVSDYTKASLNNVTKTDLHAIANQFHGEEELFPDMTWIAIMPSNVKYDIVQSWIDHAESMFSNAHVVRSRSMADDIISNVLSSFSE